MASPTRQRRSPAIPAVPTPPLSLYGTLSFWERLRLIPVFFSAVTRAFFLLGSLPFRGQGGAVTARKHFYYGLVRYVVSSLSRAQVHWISPTTEQEYHAMCKRHGLVANVVTLGDGAKALWVGDENAKYKYLFFHGGGYEIPCSKNHMEYVYRNDRALMTAGGDVGTVMLSYTVTPYARYPTQLKQAVEILRYLIYDKRVDPSHIILGGDSAGGNLVAGLLSHLLHPHPEIKPDPLAAVEGPLRGAVLISPWVDFSNTAPSFHVNRYRDILDPAFLERASNEFIGPGNVHDAYSEPGGDAAAGPVAGGWWDGLLTAAAADVYVWGGGGEVLVDSIRKFAGDLSRSKPTAGAPAGAKAGGGGGGGEVKYVETDRVAHEEMIFDVETNGGVKGQYQSDLEGWIVGLMDKE